MLKIITNIIVFVSILLAFNQAAAARVDGLYDVEILLADELLSTRKKAFDQGLDEVFIRISGDSVVMDKVRRPSASRYVKRFSYEPVAEPIANKDGREDAGEDAGEDGEMLKYRLKIQYNGRAMEKYLQANEVAVWGVYRTNVVVWLVVRDGRNEYVLKDSDQSLLKTAAVDALKRRGIPVRWPVYDQQDKQILSVSDIRGGFKTPVQDASQRYSRGPALAGSMIWNGKQWQSSWSLLTKDDDRHWNLMESDHEPLIKKAIDQAADALGVIFAVRDENSLRLQTRVRVDIQAVGSIENYQFVEKYLNDLSAVKNVKPLYVDGDNAVFDVLLRSDEVDFLDLMDNASRFTAIEKPVSDVQNIAPLIKPGNEKAHNEPTNINSVDDNVRNNTKAGANAEDVAAIVNENTQRAEENIVESGVLSSTGQSITFYFRLN